MWLPPAHALRLVAVLSIAAATARILRKLQGQPEPLQRPGNRPRRRSHAGDGFWEWLSAAAARVPFDRLPFTPLLTCEPTVSPGVSVLMRRFDWHFVPLGGYSSHTEGSAAAAFAGCRTLDSLPLRELPPGDPRTVWAAPHLLHELLDVAERRFDARRADRLVVFSANEFPLSVAFGRSGAERNATVARLQRYFSRIVYQNKDIHVSNVHLAPMGLSWGYMTAYLHHLHKERTRRGMADAFMELEGQLRLGLGAKTRGVLASWGRVAGYLDRPSTLAEVRHFSARGLLYPKSNASTRVVAEALQSRLALKAWVQTPAARAAAVELRHIPFLEWWIELPRYRFLLSPIGSAVQTAKTIEALLVLTVPIVQPLGFPVYGELLGLGFPLALVGAWDEITPAKTAEWWQALSPRLESFRRNCLTVDAYWAMYTGQVQRCT